MDLKELADAIERNGLCFTLANLDGDEEDFYTPLILAALRGCEGGE